MGEDIAATLCAAFAITLLALGGCASDGSYDAQTHQEVNEVLDGATQIMQLVIQGVQTFGGR